MQSFLRPHCTRLRTSRLPSPSPFRSLHRVACSGNLAIYQHIHRSSSSRGVSFACSILSKRQYSQSISKASASIPDSDRTDLFYHLFDPPTPLSEVAPVFAISFSSTPPADVLSSTVVGWLPASTFSEGESAGLNDFRENAKFRELLHRAVQSGLEDGIDDIQQNGAIQVQSGWMHIHDERNIPALGRIGDPDDIIASVRVEEGKILSDTYQAMPSYRLCTSDGITKLTEGLAKRLQEVILEDNKRELKL